MEAKLGELVARSEIWQVLQRYARGLDRIDNELARSCYWDDAIEDHNRFVGSPDGFIAFADRAALGFVSCQHGLLNHSCDLVGDDAYCEACFIFTGEMATPPHFMSTGRCIDHFQRRGGEWRIANRVTIVEGHYELGESQLGRGMPPAYGPGETKPASRDRNDISYHRPPAPRRPEIPRTSTTPMCRRTRSRTHSTGRSGRARCAAWAPRTSRLPASHRRSTLRRARGARPTPFCSHSTTCSSATSRQPCGGSACSATSVEQLAELMHALTLELTPEEIRRLDAAVNSTTAAAACRS